MEIISLDSLKNLADNGNSEAAYELGLRYYKVSELQLIMRKQKII